MSVWKRSYEVIPSSDSETESDDLSSYIFAQYSKGGFNKGESTIQDPDEIYEHAKMYQEYMKNVQVPTACGSVIPFQTWQELGKSLKKLYGQPLHYLTNVMLKEWDKARIGTKDEDRAMDEIVHPVKAETTIWLMEEIHRGTTSPHYLSKRWLSNPLYHAFIDPGFHGH